MNPFLTIIFFTGGWFNHQPERGTTSFCCRNFLAKKVAQMHKNLDDLMGIFHRSFWGVQQIFTRQLSCLCRIVISGIVVFLNSQSVSLVRGLWRSIGTRCLIPWSSFCPIFTSRNTIGISYSGQCTSISCRLIWSWSRKSVVGLLGNCTLLVPLALIRLSVALWTTTSRLHWNLRHSTSILGLTADWNFSTLESRKSRPARKLGSLLRGTFRDILQGSEILEFNMGNVYNCMYTCMYIYRIFISI